MVDRGFDGARRVERFGFVGLELFDVVHGKYRKIKRYCSMWNILRIRQIRLKDLVSFRSA